MLHAFGAYTGAHPQQSISGQIQLIEDPYFDSHVDAAQATQSADEGAEGSQAVAAAKFDMKDENFQKKLQMIYPVGRYLAIR